MRKGTKVAKFAHWVMIVKESTEKYEAAMVDSRVHSSNAVFLLMREKVLEESVERMYVLGLNGRNQVQFIHEVARGGLHGCSVAARDILRAAVMGNASCIVLVHNHPSGDPTPSMEDIAMTRAVAEAASIVGTPVVDHIIIGSMTSYTSMLDLGMLDLG